MAITLLNCNVVDLEHEGIHENTNIIIKDDIIKKVDPQQKEGQIIDMKESFILPGLFNMHNNLSLISPSGEFDPIESPATTVLRCYKRALDALYSGVTTLRTVGEMHRVDIHLRKMINDRWVKGPRIVAGGKGLFVTSGHGSNLYEMGIDGPEELLKAARTELAFGADHLKIAITGGIAEEFASPQMTFDEIKTVASSARSKGKYVTAHAGGSGPILTAVEAGVTCFEHGYALNSEAAKAIKKAGGYLVPTLSVTRSPDWYKSQGFNEGMLKVLSYGKSHLDAIKNAIDAGVTILNGTDIPPGDLNGDINATVREIEFLMDAGLNSNEALRSSTTLCANLCGIGDKVGLIKAGYCADLIAVPGNPLSNIRHMRQIKFVMKNGELIKNEL